MATEDKLGRSLDDIIKSRSKAKPQTQPRPSGKVAGQRNKNPAHQPRRVGAGNKKLTVIPRSLLSAKQGGNQRGRLPTTAGRNAKLNKTATTTARLSAAQAISGNARQAEIAQRRGLQTVANRLTSVSPNSARGGIPSRIGRPGASTAQNLRGVSDSPSKWKITIANDVKAPQAPVASVRMPGAGRSGAGGYPGTKAQVQTVLRGINAQNPGRVANNNSRASAPGSGLSLNERFSMIKKVGVDAGAGGQNGQRHGPAKKNLTRNSAGVIMPSETEPETDSNACILQTSVDACIAFLQDAEDPTPD
eukprot:CAMPEP_0117689182 /NCGR_PEP_ID=MMETSP0804-20121206/24321_1 /TAXON_ID=1074897 /ORGANISM="Tetraselmis astigmatica, Strain CCMP880" /LENGTH=304 /DNA_ID=CAMNT_0005501873 /DNA_START=35 /DNA_END=950 /DNA_ORIENTATION=+